MPTTNRVSGLGRGVRRAGGLAICAAGFATAIALPALAAPQFTILDLGTIGGSSSFMRDTYQALNNAGQVVGFATVPGNASNRAFRTLPNAAMTPANSLGTLGGAESYAVSINAAGQVVGYSNPSPSSEHAFRTAPGGAIDATTDLGTLGGVGSAGNGINASGVVVGRSTTATGATHAFRTAANAAINAQTDDLGTLGGAVSRAFAVNSAGYVVGSSNVAGNASVHAFRIAPGAVITPAADLGTLGGNATEAYGINDAGQTIGYSKDASGQPHAFRTAPDGLITPAVDLGTLAGKTDSTAFAINASGQVVGFSGGRAFLFDGSGPLLDLNDFVPAGSGWLLREAHGINDLGQIAGYGEIGGNFHAFLLTPVPEPTGTLVLAIAAAPRLLSRRRAMRIDPTA